MRRTPQQDKERRDAAYERGWLDSLRAYYALSLQPLEDCYDYAAGWQACAAYRWANPANRGIAPDTSYRMPRG